MKLNRRILFALSLLTLLGFSAIGLADIHFLQEKTVQEFFTEKIPLMRQLLLGSFFGASAVFAAIVLVMSPWFRASRKIFTGLIASLNPAWYHIVFYSFCAAVGEEILFRGAIQYHIGIWPTSIVFIFLHGYLNPFNWPVMLYGFFMIIISSGLGYLFEIYGIYAAMIAHFIFDVAMFGYLKWNVGRE